MIVVQQRYDTDKFDPRLVYDGEELWGYDPLWTNNVSLVGLSEEDFAQFFDGPNFVATTAEEDPFEGIPNADELLRNYPPGSEDIPDLPTPEPVERVLPEGYESEKRAEDTAENVAESAMSRIEEKDDASGQLSTEEYERVDDALYNAYERTVWWDGDNLGKAPAAWESSEEVPEFVMDVLKDVVKQGVVYDQIDGYSTQAAKAIENLLEENITQPQGWSVGSITEDLLDLYSGMDEQKALNIVRTELSAIFNTAREEAYKEREDSDRYRYYWQGPNDARTTEICEEIKEEVEDRGGNVPLNELRSILRSKAKKYENTAEGGTPERVSEWTPHFSCRHTFVRDVKADL